MSLRRKHTSEKGAVMVEHALVLPVMVLVIFATLELLRCTYVGLTTQFTATRVLREAVIGPEVFDVAPYNQSQTPFESYILNNVQALCGSLSVNLSPENIRVTCVGGAGGCDITAGRPGALVQVEISRPTTVFIFGELNIESVAVARNEYWGL